MYALSTLRRLVLAQPNHGYKHELYFDAQGNRIYAKIEYGRRDIGSAVPEAIYNADVYKRQVKNLRRKLEEAGASIEIKAVYGFGYKLID